MRHLWTVFILATLIVVSGWVGGEVGIAWLSEPWFVGIGVMLLMAYAAGEGLRTLGLPALLGWIAVGILMGPSFAALVPVDYPLAVISDDVIESLALIQVLIIGLIGMLAGAKFKVSDLSSNARLPLLISGAFLLVVIPLTMAAVLVAGQLFPGQLAFLHDAPATTQVTIALFFGVLSFGLAPSVTVAMLQELRSRGPMSTVILGAVIVAEFILFVLFAVVLSLGRAVAGPDGFSVAAVFDAIPGVTWQLSLSAVLGMVLGAAVAAYLRYVRREPLLFLLVALVVGYFGVVAADAEPLLTFLIAGFFVQNATQQGDLLAKVLERIALPVFVLYFATVAAGIDLEGTLAYLPLVVFLIAARCAALYWGARWASRKAVRENHVYEYLRTSFFSQDAVVLVLAGVVAHPDEPFAWGAEFQSVVVATVVAYLIIGPILLKVGLDRSGETRKARRAFQGQGTEVTQSSMESFESASESVELASKLEEPRFKDAWLRGHVADLRGELVEQGHRVFYGPVVEHFRDLHGELEDVAEVVEAQAGGLESLVEAIREGGEPEELVEMVRRRQKEYARQMIPVVERVEAISGVAITAETMEEFFDYLRELQDQQSLYRIEREAELDEPDSGDPIWLRSLKAVQRLRTRIMGQGYRSVPVGKLWRYHVELALPIRLASRTPEVVVYYERFWNRLWRHLSRVDDFWDELITGITRSKEENGGETVEARAERKQRQIDRFFEEFQGEQEALDGMAQKGAHLIQHRFGGAIQRCYERFLDATGRAGTIYLPRFRYRAAARFGPGRRAERRVVDRLKRQDLVVSGYRGWIRLDHEVSTFEQWSTLFRNRIDEAIDEALGRGWREEFDELRATCGSYAQALDTKAGNIDEIKSIYHDELRPKIAAFRHNQEELVSRLLSGDATRSLTAEIDERIEGLPESIQVIGGAPEEMVLASADEQYELLLRRWMASQVGREVGLRVVEFNERAAARIERRLSLLSGVEQALEFNLVAVQKGDSELDDDRNPAQMAHQGLVRARQLIEAFLEGAKSEKGELRQWFEAELDDIVEAAVVPIEARDLGTVKRRLARAEGRSFVGRGETWLSGTAGSLAAQLGIIRRRWGRRVAGVIAQIRGVLIEDCEEVDRLEIRRLLYAGELGAQSQAPPIYRRLFVPMPLDIPEFYRHRSALEERVLETVDRFFDGEEHTLLISGEAGVGKRTVVRHLIPGRIYAVEGGLTEEQVVTVNLGRTGRDEEAICGGFADALFESERARSFAELDRCIRRRGKQRRIVVVEQADRIFSRSESGMARARRFLQMVESTAESILWVVVMGSAARDFLRTHLELDAYFTHHEKLSAFSAGELEAMIMARHRVSGFEIEFETPPAGLWQRAQQPLFGDRAKMVARQRFFERLAQLSEGNPRAALLHWLRAVSVDPLDESKITVSPLEVRDVEVLSQLSLEQRLVLTILIQHQALRLPELAQILGLSQQNVAQNIRHLRRLGFVDVLPEATDIYRVRPLASVWVSRELRARNLI